MEAQRHDEQLQPSNVEASVAVLAVEMRYVRAGIEEIKANQHQTVSRNEWEQWKLIVEKELQSRRIPWPSVGAFIPGAVAVALVVIDKVAN